MPDPGGQGKGLGLSTVDRLGRVWDFKGLAVGVRVGLSSFLRQKWLTFAAEPRKAEWLRS